MAQTARSFRLSENFRSRESLLDFVNSVFRAAHARGNRRRGIRRRCEIEIWFDPETRGGFQRRERFLCRERNCCCASKPDATNRVEADNEPGADELADLDEIGKRGAAACDAIETNCRQTQHEIWDDEEKVFRAVEWRDMAVLLRAPSGKSEIFAKEFERAGVPLVIERGGFYDSSEISDLLSLLQLLDNPLQDVPCIAVLRSPLVGLSLDELAEIRLTVAREHFWTALNQVKIESQNLK